MKNKRREFNIHLNQKDRDIIDELMENNINISSVFKSFIRKYLDKIKALNKSTDCN